jgi:predicted PurR-regulated permease PerM
MAPTDTGIRGLGSSQWRRLAGLGVATAVVVWLMSKLLLVIFASILIAIALCELAKPITKYAKIPHTPAVIISTLFLIAVIGWPFTEFGSRLWAQFDAIAKDLPAVIVSIKQALEEHESIRFIEQTVGEINLSNVAAPVAARLTSVISSIGEVLAYVILLLFGGVYLALNPNLYLRGVMRFIPPDHRGSAQCFIEQSGLLLRTWLTTQLLVVLMNAVAGGFGLWILGVDGAAALAMLGGLLSFIPYIGTIVAMLIGALAALAQGPAFAFYVLVVFGLVSVVEGYFVTPYIQSKTLALPPVVLIFAIFAFGILFGTLGIILAAPLVVVLMVAIDIYYQPTPL